jgi:hypothetical protein
MIIKAVEGYRTPKAPQFYVVDRIQLLFAQASP